MHPHTHALIGWGVANLAPSLDRRSRALVFFASVIPDLDGLTIVNEDWYHAWHRLLCHNIVFAAACGATAAALSPPGRRALVAGLVLVNFHLHLVCDILGAKGVDPGSGAEQIWGVPYLAPFDRTWFHVPWQWPLNGWQNVAVTIAALVLAAWIAKRHGRTPLEPFSLRGDAAVMEVVRRRLG